MDDFADPAPATGPGRACERAGTWLGAVVPKRHARRAVTRSLVKRQVRAAAERVAAGGPPGAAGADGRAGLCAGLWVVRLRAPYPRDEYPSAASDALRAVVRAELDRLFENAARRCAATAGGSRPSQRRGPHAAAR